MQSLDQTFQLLQAELKKQVAEAETKARQLNPKAELIETLRDYFDLIDVDGSGEIDAVELSRAMATVGMVGCY